MPAFPGVEGYGANATGGRGGKVLIVTNSNDSGVGSLRWALEQNGGPRTVVFAVNTVKLQSNIDIYDGDVTIAGQTARGVEVSGAGIAIRDSNVIMRGMMIRPGDALSGPNPDDRDALKIAANGKVVQNVVVDHNSFSWAIDEVVSVWGSVSNVSFTNNIVAQGLDDSLHSKGAHSTGMLLIASDTSHQASRFTIADNLFAYNAQRNPWVKHGSNVEVANNLIIGTGDQQNMAALGDDESQFQHLNFSANILNNYYTAGAETARSERPYYGIRSSADYDGYFEGNLSYSAGGRELDAVHSGKAATSPRFAGSGLDLLDADAVYGSVMANAGANPGLREGADKRLIDLISTNKGGLVDSVAEAGGYGGRSAFAAPLDTDKDGMPDAFERSIGTNPTVFDANGDRNANGYTNLEEYLNSLIPDVSFSPSDPRGGVEMPTPRLTGTTLDAVFSVIATDPGLIRNTSEADAAAATAAASDLNNLIVSAIRTLGLADDRALTVGDVMAVSEWIRADAGRAATFQAAFGVTGANETGFQRVVGEGGQTVMSSVLAADTLFGTAYRVGFAHSNGQFGGLSGMTSVSTFVMRDTLGKLLDAEVSAGALVSGNAPSFARTGTGLDQIIDVALKDASLGYGVSTIETRGGVEAAVGLNALIVDGVRALGLAKDKNISVADVQALSNWIRADGGRASQFREDYGLNSGTESGFQLIAGESASTKLYNVNAIDTVFATIYRVGFSYSGDVFAGLSGASRVSVWQISDWMNRVFANDFATGELNTAPIAPPPNPDPTPPAPTPPAPTPPASSNGTGTALDLIVDLINTDPVLSWKLSAAEISGGAAAAAGLNQMIADGFRATGIGDDGAISVVDVYSLNAWFRADSARVSAFTAFYGSTAGAESGYQLVADEEAGSRLYGVNAVDTLFGTIYRIGFALDGTTFTGPAGSRYASVWQVQEYLDDVLGADVAAGKLNTGSAPSAPAPTMTGLDRIVGLIQTDPVLDWKITDAEVSAGAAAATGLNALIKTGVDALGLMNDRTMSINDVRALSGWIRSDAARLDSFLFHHGREITGADSGYEAVDNEGAGSKIFGLNAVNTVFGSIYDVGFAINGDYLTDPYNSERMHIGTVADWMSALLGESFIA